MKVGKSGSFTLLLVFAIAQLSCSYMDCMRLSLGNEDDIREALFRYLFEHNESAMHAIQEKAVAFCLSIDNNDPSEDFLKRFEGYQLVVLKGSDCATAENSRVVLRDTRQPALRFYVGKIMKLDNCGVEVSAGYYAGNLSASRALYILVHENGRWAVKVVREKVISHSFGLFEKRMGQVLTRKSKDVFNRHAPFAPGFPPFEMAS